MLIIFKKVQCKFKNFRSSSSFMFICCGWFMIYVAIRLQIFNLSHWKSYSSQNSELGFSVNPTARRNEPVSDWLKFTRALVELLRRLIFRMSVMARARVCVWVCKCGGQNPSIRDTLWKQTNNTRPFFRSTFAALFVIYKR